MPTPEGKIPRNHYVVDMFDYELPRQYLAWQALQDGEFPWWEPYSSGGSPLATEAHISLTDPLRLVLYKLFSFEAAFNWTLILHSFLTGISAFLLMRWLAFSSIATLFAALSFQFATNNAFFIFPPNVQAAFIYYPILWILWGSCLRAPHPVKLIGSAIAVAAVLFSGNQQSHAYLPFFMAAFCAGYSGLNRTTWIRSLLIVAGSFAIGLLLSLPVLVPQVELYHLSTRDVLQGAKVSKCLSGIFSLAGIFPWCLGTFKTLDLGKAIGDTGLGFSVYVGTAAWLLAIFALVEAFKKRVFNVRPELRVALFLLVAYFGLICSTPLINLLYPRSSGLAVLGLVVLSAAGMDALNDQFSFPTFHKVRTVLVSAVVAIAIFLSAFSFFVYPSLIQRIKSFVLKREQSNVTLDVAPHLRSFQVENFPNEISLKNPEVVLAVGSALSLLLIRKRQNRSYTWAIILALNLAPLLLYSRRFIPCEPIATWRMLLEGGPEQKKLIALSAGGLRIREESPGRFENVFPGVTALYYRVHLINGYTSFRLTRTGQNPYTLPANILAKSNSRGLAVPEVSVVHTNNVRFVWSTPNNRHIEILNETCNKISLRIPAGNPGVLVRTDTWYPGWSAAAPPDLKTSRNGNGNLTVEIPAVETRLTLRYTPSYHKGSIVISSLTALFCLVILTSKLFSRDTTA